MRTVMRAFLLAALVAFAARTALSAEPLPRLLGFGSSDSCEWCKVLERRVFSSETWRNWAASHVAFTRVDLPRGDGVLAPDVRERNNALADRLDVKGIPTFVLLAAESDAEFGRVKVPDSARGLGRDMTPEAFIAALEDVLARAPSLGEAASRRFNHAPSLGEAASRRFWCVYRFIPVVLLLGLAAFLLVDKSKLPLALRGLKKVLGGTASPSPPAASSPVPVWKRLLAFFLVLAAFLLAVL